MKAALVPAALLLLAAAPPHEEADIVVLGRRLASLEAIVGRDGMGKLTCSLTQSTGRPKLDDALCRTAARCVGKGAVEQAAVRTCIDQRKPQLLADVRRELAAAETR